ncbi:MAG TPA: hypothetical protein VKC66_02330 [Xanthobacteraceae bacterium]|nr:hypothetical protein [Xanthobacteraceae bacterium]
MRRITGVLGPALVVLVAVPSASGFAQSNGAVRDLIRPSAATRTAARTLAPAEIISHVERAGFDPMSGPVQHGRVYVLFALDPTDRAVKLTVDADSGRVLWVAGIAGTWYGNPGHHAWWRYGPPPVPPADMPNMRPGGNNIGPVTRNSSLRLSPPLPRTRPADLSSAAAKDSTPQSEPAAAAPGRPNGAPLPSTPPTMVPVAPLE